MGQVHDDAPDGPYERELVARRYGVLGVGPVGCLSKADEGHGVDDEGVDVCLDTALAAATARPRRRHHARLPPRLLPDGAVDTVGDQRRKGDAEVKTSLVPVHRDHVRAERLKHF